MSLPSSHFRRDNCRLCGSRDLSLVIQLAPTPPANAFLAKSELEQREEKFPLDVFFCRSCHHVQLLDVVSPEILFKNYVYVSGTSPVFVEHFRNYCESVSRRFGLHAGSFAFEIGSNDGTLLRQFQNKGLRVLGVDPAESIAAEATKSGVKTLPLFFNEEAARRIRSEHGPADVILANNVFAHIDDLDSVTKGIAHLLGDRGVFVFEVSYLVDVFEKTLFDTIYHEHLCYHSVGPLVSFFRKHGLELIDAERVDSHGGSLRATVQKAAGPHPVESRVAELVHLEKHLGLDKESTFKEFSGRIDELGRKLHARLTHHKAEHKKIAAFGAPAKATTLMHHFGIGPDLIDFIVDDNPLKQGLYSPGFHIPVKPSGSIAEEKPDFLVILAWNFADSIIEKNKKFRDQGGRFIVPLPQMKEV